MSNSLLLGTTSGGAVKKLLVDTDGNLQVDVVSMTGGGDATAANQTTMIGHLSTIEGDTTSLDAKITACDTTGKATLLEQQSQTTQLTTIAGDTTSLDAKVVACNTGAVVVSSGNMTESNSGDILTNVSKLSQGYDAQVASGGSGLQQVLVYGRDTGGNLDAITTDSNGKLEVNVHDEEKTTANATSSWSSTSIPSAGSASTTGIDIQGIKHISIFGNTTNLTDPINVEYSVDNTNWFIDTSSYVYPDSSSGDFAHNYRNIPFRYVRWNKTNNGVGSETITLNYITMKF